MTLNPAHYSVFKSLRVFLLLTHRDWDNDRNLDHRGQGEMRIGHWDASDATAEPKGRMETHPLFPHEEVNQERVCLGGQFDEPLKWQPAIRNVLDFTED